MKFNRSHILIAIMVFFVSLTLAGCASAPKVKPFTLIPSMPVILWMLL
jgi:starvation-inducible outer membrane lipoprotein